MTSIRKSSQSAIVPQVATKVTVNLQGMILLTFSISPAELQALSNHQSKIPS